VIGVINALQVFAEPYVMTKGGPGDASRTVVLTIYEAAFKNLELGYGSAMAMILFIVILLVTAGQFWISKRSVFYQ
jgi:multiple sugar transport system permease protein